MISVIVRVKDNNGNYIKGITVEFSHQPFCEAVWNAVDKTDSRGDVRFTIPSDDDDRNLLERIKQQEGTKID